MALLGFLNRNSRVEGEIVDLIERYHISAKDASDGVETVYYNIYLHGSSRRVGYIDLRFTVEGMMYYYGHVGYRIIEEERGHHYAYEACRVLFREARDSYGFKELLITCSPENTASYRTLVKLGGELVETVFVPVEHELYRRGEKVKNVFRFKL